MGCLNPLGGWYGQNLTDSGKRPIVFRMRDGFTDKPIDLPCGRCIGCKRDHANAWGVRCYHESTLHLRNCFLTLTYDEQHAPKDGRVSVDDLQKFFKRVRRRGLKMRYFACGEYGGQTLRPHYHVLCFGQDFLEGAYRNTGGPKGEYYESPFITEVWGNGRVTIAPMEPGSVFYTTGYTLKNLDQPDCFHISSRKPYIGYGWLAKHYDNIARLGFCTIEGKRVIVPSAYLKRPEFALEFDELKLRRQEAIDNRTPDETWKRKTEMRAREVNLKAQSERKRSKV